MQQGGSHSLGRPLVEWLKHSLGHPLMKGEKYYRSLHEATCGTIIVDGCKYVPGKEDIPLFLLPFELPPDKIAF